MPRARNRLHVQPVGPPGHRYGVSPSSLHARLVGTRLAPAVELRFGRDAVLPAAVDVPVIPLAGKRHKGPTSTHLPAGTPMNDWVRALPQRRWDPARGAWMVTSLGVDPDEVLAAAGFVVDVSHAAKVGLRRLSQLCNLKVVMDPVDNTVTHVYPRLFPVELSKPHLPASAMWSWDKARFEVATTALLRTKIPLPDDVRETAKRLLEVQVATGPLALAAQAAARAKSLDEAGSDVEAALVDHAGELPAWFGLDLYPYQRAGALALLAGHTGLVDEPGLGKTRQALAALALSDAQRVVLVVPPVVLTNWRREVVQSGLAVLPPKPVRKTRAKKPRTGAGEVAAALAPPTDPTIDLPDETMVPHNVRPGTHHVVIIQAGRKAPSLPEKGVVIVADSLIASRPVLTDELLDWCPDAFVLDEAHRTMTWDSTRSIAVRRLATLIEGLSITISGTPMFASPAELATQLAISGHLNPVFGGLDDFLSTYCRKNKYDKWVARKANLPKLNALLMEHVWVRRTKAQVLPDLPKKARYAKYLDVDLKDFRRAHAEVHTIVQDWVHAYIEATGEVPDEEVAASWLGNQLHLVTLLRRAAGMSKIDAAADLIREHVAATTEDGPDGQPVFTRPLIVWTHHKDVSAAMAAAVPAAVGDTRVIVGSTNAEERGRIVDDFQAGKVPVLVASITAAGVGITLTRGCDAMFVETDWSPQLVVQAEDRQCRIGQERPVTCTTLIAEGTLDPQIQAIQRRKISVLEDVLVGGDLNVSVLEGDDEGGSSESMRVLLAMYAEIVDKLPASAKALLAAA